MSRASLNRRTVLGAATLPLCLGGIAAPAASHTASASTASAAGLQNTLDMLAERAMPGVFGAVVLDLKTGHSWEVNADRACPMMSVFKAPLGAAVLAKVDAKILSLERTVTITRADLRLGASRIAEDFAGETITLTVGDLLARTVSQSDNTAADVLVKVIGGPQAVTDFLRAAGIYDMRVDLDEGGIEHVFSGLGSARTSPANETAEQREERLWRGHQAFLQDARNRSTPKAGAEFLRKLWNGTLLSKTSTAHLLELMYAQTKPARLRADIPGGVRLADKCGTSISMRGTTAAFNDIGILTWPDGHAVVISAFLTASQAPQSERLNLFVELARTTATALRQ